MKHVFEFVMWGVIASFGVLALYIVLSNFPILGFRSFLVQSGSMEPSIMTGDIVLIQRQQTYLKNDVVTFRDKDERIVTHRITDIVQEEGELPITTKGDANRSEDADRIGEDQIIGKVVLVIPKLGFLVTFGKSLPGLIILALIPVALFIADELITHTKNV